MTKATRAVLDYCADLLSETRNEALLLALFECPKGEWVAIATLCVQTGIGEPPAQAPGADLFVTWLDEPLRLEGYATIVFCSPTELWSTIGIYNRTRLKRTHPA